MYYVYVLFSKKDQRLYVGRSDNLRQRVKDHNSGNVESTKNRIPLILVYYEAFFLKISAIKQELFYKTGQGRRVLKNRLEETVKQLKSEMS